MRIIYLLLCTTKQADGADVIGVFSQSPLSFDSLCYSLRNIYWLWSVRDRERQKEVTNKQS